MYVLGYTLTDPFFKKKLSRFEKVIKKISILDKTFSKNDILLCIYIYIYLLQTKSFIFFNTIIMCCCTSNCCKSPYKCNCFKAHVSHHISLNGQS